MDLKSLKEDLLHPLIDSCKLWIDLVVQVLEYEVPSNVNQCHLEIHYHLYLVFFLHEDLDILILVLDSGLVIPLIMHADSHP